ncbi:MAG TPA: hypothetical protein VIM84_07375 [Gemmatimonadales bacterium]
MLAAVRAAMLAGLLLLPSRNPPGAAQVRDTAGLDFLGFRAGARLEELNQQLRNAGGEGLRCRQARADRRVSECRGFLRGSDEVPDIALWISAIDSVAGIMTLFGRVDSLQLDDWRTSLEHRYGRVGLRVQGSQSMLQWVRRGRMIRLTWRVERREQVASVSLVDGHVLDGWGRTRTQPKRTR